MKKNTLTFLIWLSLMVKLAAAQEIVNGGFEIIDNKKLPRNWVIDNKGDSYQSNIDNSMKHSGKYAVKIDGTVQRDTANALVYNSFGTASSTKIKTVEISGWVKMFSPVDSAAALMMQDLKGERITRTYASKTNGWQKLDVKLITDAAKPWYGFYYGFEVSSKTKVWLDDITIKVDGKLISDPESMNFEPGKGNIAWLNSHVYSLKSATIINAHIDLEPLGKLCQNAKVVGIGEPTHGTKEAFQFKLRLLEYLVTQKGFNTIALEEVIPTCDRMNDIINNTPAAIKDSLLSMPFYKCWKTAEVAAMLNWVSVYNSKHAKKVKLIGIDMEDIRCRSSRRLLRDYGKLYNKAIYAQTLLLDDHVDSLLSASIKAGQETKTIKLADTVKAILNNIQRLTNDAGLMDKAQLFKLQTYINVCSQWLNSRFYNGDRDNYMAVNIAFYVKNHPNDKVMVWAHNFHIANAGTAATTRQMGAYLKDLLGKGYVALGFTTAGGTYTAADDYTQKNWHTFLLEGAYRGTYEYILSKAKSNFYFLPLKQSNKNAQWLAMPMKHLDVPYVYSGGDDYKFYGNLSSVFDGIVFCKTTSASDSYLKIN